MKLTNKLENIKSEIQYPIILKFTNMIIELIKMQERKKMFQVSTRLWVWARGTLAGGSGVRSGTKVPEPNHQRKERNIELSSGGRSRTGSGGRSQCQRWSGAELERQVVAREGITMMDTGEVLSFWWWQVSFWAELRITLSTVSLLAVRLCLKVVGVLVCLISWSNASLVYLLAGMSPSPCHHHHVNITMSPSPCNHHHVTITFTMSLSPCQHKKGQDLWCIETCSCTLGPKI